jgi:hypothetical protein
MGKQNFKCSVSTEEFQAVHRLLTMVPTRPDKEEFRLPMDDFFYDMVEFFSVVEEYEKASLEHEAWCQANPDLVDMRMPDEQELEVVLRTKAEDIVNIAIELRARYGIRKNKNDKSQAQETAGTQ